MTTELRELNSSDYQKVGSTKQNTFNLSHYKNSHENDAELKIVAELNSRLNGYITYLSKKKILTPSTKANREKAVDTLNKAIDYARDTKEETFLLREISCTILKLKATRNSKLKEILTNIEAKINSKTLITYEMESIKKLTMQVQELNVRLLDLMDNFDARVDARVEEAVEKALNRYVENYNARLSSSSAGFFNNRNQLQPAPVQNFAPASALTAIRPNF